MMRKTAVTAGDGREVLRFAWPLVALASFHQSRKAYCNVVTALVLCAFRAIPATGRAVWVWFAREYLADTHVRTRSASLVMPDRSAIDGVRHQGGHSEGCQSEQRVSQRISQTRNLQLGCRLRRMRARKSRRFVSVTFGTGNTLTLPHALPISGS